MKGSRIRQKLSQVRISQKELARLLDVSPQAVASILHGKDVRTGTVERICQVLNLPITYFYDEDTNADLEVKAEEEKKRELEFLRGKVVAYETALHLLAEGRGIQLPLYTPEFG